MNMNMLAVLLCEAESGKKEVNIAQMKDTLARLTDFLSDNDLSFDTLTCLLKAAEKKRK